jgi:hypothetical protein
MEIVLTALVVAVGVAGVYFIGRLLYAVIGGIWVVRRATGGANEQMRRELAGLSIDGLRARLLENKYLSVTLRNDANVQAFLARVARGDEVSLAQAYPREKLYGMLVDAERPLRIPGRPEAVDEVQEVSAVLQALAARRAPGGPTTG